MLDRVTRVKDPIRRRTACFILGEITGMTRQGFNVELRKVDAQWRASFYAAGASEATPWRAVTTAAWQAINDPRMAA